MNAIILEKRKALQTLSHAVQHTAKDEGLNIDEFKVNELLLKFAYNPENEYTFNSFAGWKREGFTIKKGSKAFVLWGQPISTNRTNQDETKTEPNEEEENKRTFFPLAYLFRSDQVLKPIKLPKKDKQIKKVEVVQPVIELDL